MESKIYINNQPYPFTKGQTILQVLKNHLGENHVPTLCDVSNLEPFGACRVCSVDVALKEDGPMKSVASCHTPASEGMHIFPDSPKIQKLRKNIVELVLTDHPLDCLTCEVNGNCELQTVAARVGIRKVRYPEGKNHLNRDKDLSHPYMTSDLSKCINCARCVRACEEVQGQFVLSMAGRGFDARIIKSHNNSFFDSDCVSCGACAQACPTSAISDVFESKSIKIGAKKRTVCTYCGVGCNLEVRHNGNEILSIQAPYDAEVNQGHTCLKGRYAFKFYNHKDRLRKPLIKENGTFKESTWPEVMAFLKSKITEIRSQHGPDSIAGISSARCTNEENYLMQKFIRAVIGTNNIDGCARVCHSPTALGMQKTFGTGAATNSIEDLKYTDCMLVIGANPTSAHPVTGAKIKQQAIKGKTLIVIDPRKTELAKYATHHIQLKPGTNVAILNMMIYYIMEAGLADTRFIASRTEGFDDFKEHILRLDMDELSRESGVEKEIVKQAALDYAKARNAMSFHGLGVTEHMQGTYTVMLIADLAMLTGNIGRPGVGVNPLRGQNNVQGMADMGCQPHQGAGYLDVTDPINHQNFEQHYGVKIPNKIGFKIPEMFDAALNGTLKMMWVMGEDIVQTDPNHAHVVEALEKLDLLVVQDIFMSPTAEKAHVVLPAASFLEKSGTFTNGERRIQKVNAVVEPLEGTKTDGQIISEMMQVMGFPQEDYAPDILLQEISEIVPFFAGVTWENLGKNGKQWPVAAGGGDTQILHAETFKIGKGKFWNADYIETPETAQHKQDFPFILTTNRDLEHYNCGTMTRRTGNVKINTEDLLWIHPEDAQDHGIEDGQMVCVESPRGKVDLKAMITEGVKKGVLSTTFHFPEVMVNLLTSNIHDTEALCPEYKVVAVRIRKSRGKYALTN